MKLDVDFAVTISQVCDLAWRATRKRENCDIDLSWIRLTVIIDNEKNQARLEATFTVDEAGSHISRHLKDAGIFEQKSDTHYVWTVPLPLRK